MREIHFSDLLAMFGIVITTGIWLSFYFSTKKKIYIVIAVITLVAGFFVFKEMGFTLDSFINLFK